MKIGKSFSGLSKFVAHISGQPIVFILAFSIIIIWLLLGGFFFFSDTWQLIINTATSIITFLMVFIIQNSQNRFEDATQLKLDEIIRALGGAHNALLDLEEGTEEELKLMKEKYGNLAKKDRAKLIKVKKKPKTPKNKV